MIGRIVEVADDNRHLSMSRGFMVVEDTGNDHVEMGRVPLDDICAVVANAHGLSYTNGLLVALSQRGAPFVLCAANHNAVGMLLPIEGNFEQSKRIEAQIGASLPTHKRMWAEIIRAKLQQQASVLDAVGSPHAPLAALVAKVRSGDPDNIEAQGARRYWPLLLGSEFRRDQTAGGANALLNYGYTVLRAATARAIVAAGLHPSIGIHHSHDNNALRLVDDVMEPFRPMIDMAVWRLHRKKALELTPDGKRALVMTLYEDMQTSAGATPVMVCLQRLATSLAQVYVGERKKLDLPLAGLPLALVANAQSE